MEACCSFKSLVGSSCGFDAKDRKRQTQIVPNNVSQSMRKARNIDGSLMFDASEYLTGKQITSFFLA